MIDPTPDEAELLKIAQHFEFLASSPAWTLIKEELDRFVKEAHEQMVSLAAPSPLKAQAVLVRYQQRLATRNRIVALVEDQAENKRLILETLQEPSGDDDARDYERA